MAAIGTYWKASRPYSYPAAVVPVLIGAAFAKWTFSNLHLNWWNLVLVVMGCVLAQGISNLVNDLADFKFGVDHEGVPGRKSALVSGDLSFQQMLGATLIVCAGAALIGIYFALKIGLPMVALVALGAIISIEYTAPPLKLKYHGLGDLGVFLCFGLGMSFGSYMVQTYFLGGWLEASRLTELFIYSIPSALLVVAILQTNNHRDRDKDAQFGGKTVANILSYNSSQIYLLGLVFLPYLIVVGMIGFRTAAWPLLLVFLTLPIALELLKRVRTKRYEGIVPIAARLDGLFGILMAAGMSLQIWLRAKGQL